MRLFFAVELSPEARERIARAQAELRRPGAVVGWTRPEDAHLTLRFLGEADAGNLDSIRSVARTAASDARPFRFRLAGLGTFPPGSRPRIIWAGVEEPTGELRRLAATLEGRLAPLGFPSEGRPYHAHVTLGRVRSCRTGGELAVRVRSTPFEGGTVQVPHFVLVRSTLRPAGALHEILERFALGT
jgi:2'-5' RNA ligase